MVNAITIDVEDWYQSFANIYFVSRDKYKSRIVEDVKRVLRLLEEYDVKATFFVLGCDAERNPEIVKMIAEQGHELATHGYSHEFIYNLTPERFAAELEQSIKLLEELSGQKVLGHRAPAWSITEKSEWAIDIIFEKGLLYDSSIAPFVNHIYGIHGFNKEPHIIRKKNNELLYEFPFSTIPVFNKNLPVGGGFFLRIYPYWFMKYAFKKINSLGYPAVLYFHPWDLDINPPRLKMPWILKKRYFNLKNTEKKIRNLLSDFKFAPIKDILSFNNTHKHKRNI